MEAGQSARVCGNSTRLAKMNKTPLSLKTLDPVTRLKMIAESYDVHSVCNVVLDDPNFAKWSASSHENLHHHGDGGLALHTYEVLSLCLKNSFHPELREEKMLQAIVCAAIFHDYGKIWDYHQEMDPVKNVMVWKSTPHKHKIHHISRSAIEWSHACTIHPTPDPSINDEVLHAILAHHGQRAWGSPVEPQTRLAWLLHLCDNMSARMNDCDTRTLHPPTK